MMTHTLVCVYRCMRAIKWEYFWWCPKETLSSKSVSFVFHQKEKKKTKRNRDDSIRLNFSHFTMPTKICVAHIVIQSNPMPHTFISVQTFHHQIYWFINCRVKHPFTYIACCVLIIETFHSPLHFKIGHPISLFLYRFIQHERIQWLAHTVCIYAFDGLLSKCMPICLFVSRTPFYGTFAK